MPRWSRTLNLASITDASLRRDYSEMRRLVARFAHAEYAAARLLLPAYLVPDVIAAVAFMHASDDRIDQGPLDQRLAALADWDMQVRSALDGGPTDQPVLRTLIHTISRRPQLRRHVEDFLAGAPSEVQWEGFATEADFQDYVDAYSHPAFMLIACLLAPPPPADSYSASCRTFIEASQRLDFLQDIAEDLHNGRLGIPHDALAQHGVTPDQLRTGHASDRLSELVDQQTAQIRTGLAASHRLADLAEPHGQHLLRALVALQELRLRTVQRKGPALLRRSPGTPAAAALRVLAREYQAARRQNSAA
ncbi:squalene/phytoene synthase family protein [Streptomyces sp. NPDC051907]|uniref:squalene/phytoene synthase family protein n=1 Tax=Streptomyces sp. NPDC051907 TaxID=3155284 RepID=UPI00341202F4